MTDERIETQNGSPEPFFYFGYENGRPMLNNAEGAKRALERADIDRTQSILSQRRDPESYPEVAATGDRLKRSSSIAPGALARRAPFSTQLVDAMTEHAGAVVVCEKDGATSRLNRLDAAQIARWRAC